MLVLSIYDHIEPICISEKLGLYISNLPNDADNAWRDELTDELDFAIKFYGYERSNIGDKTTHPAFKLYRALFPSDDIPEILDRNALSKISELMICLYFDYKYDDMPLGGYETNCFDGRFCEDDYAEKIIEFISFVSHTSNYASTDSCSRPVPNWIYSSYQYLPDYRRLFWKNPSANECIASLKYWGWLLDNFLQEKKDYLLFNYLVNSVYKDKENNEVHLMKAYSLCQLFLEGKNSGSMDEKLAQFLMAKTDDRRVFAASLIRKMRNKIAHGDFLSLESVLEEYAKEFLDGSFWFDYTEYSRRNWILGVVCSQLDYVVGTLIYLLLNNKEQLLAYKDRKI